MATLKVPYDNKGIYTWKTGAVYEGYWKNNKRNGKGRMTNPDGKVYEGDFVENVKQGYGT